MSRRPRGATAATVAPSCQHANDVWSYLDGELSAARCRAMAAHLASCPSCTRRAKDLRALLTLCRSAGAQALPADVRARARARVRALQRQGRT